LAAVPVVGVPPAGVVALVDPPPGFVVAFVVGFVVGVVGRPEIFLNTVNIFIHERCIWRERHEILPNK